MYLIVLQLSLSFKQAVSISQTKRNPPQSHTKTDHNKSAAEFCLVKCCRLSYRNEFQLLCASTFHKAAVIQLQKKRRVGVLVWSACKKHAISMQPRLKTTYRMSTRKTNFYGFFRIISSVNWTGKF